MSAEKKAKSKTVRRDRVAKHLSRRVLQMMATCCSADWAKEVEQGRAEYPPPGMLLSECCVATGGLSNPSGTVGTRRWTPPQAVAVEDLLDRLSTPSAQHYYYPSALRYDHATPCREVEDDTEQRAIRLDFRADGPAIRTVKVAAWAFKRQHVRIRRNGRLIATEVCHYFPETVQVTG